MLVDITSIGLNSINIDIEGEIYEYLKYCDLTNILIKSKSSHESKKILLKKRYDAKIYDEIEILLDLITDLMCKPSKFSNTKQLIRIYISFLREKEENINKNQNLKYHINKVVKYLCNMNSNGYSYLIQKSTISNLLLNELKNLINSDLLDKLKKHTIKGIDTYD